MIRAPLIFATYVAGSVGSASATSARKSVSAPQKSVVLVAGGVDASSPPDPPVHPDRPTLTRRTTAGTDLLERTGPPSQTRRDSR